MKSKTWKYKPHTKVDFDRFQSEDVWDIKYYPTGTVEPLMLVERNGTTEKKAWDKLRRLQQELEDAGSQRDR